MLLDEKSIPVGTPVRFRFTVDVNAKGSAVLAAAWSGGGQTGGHDQCTAAPGGFCTASLTPGMKGLLRVVIDMTSEADKGTLEIEPFDTSIPFQGDQTWLYVVE